MQLRRPKGSRSTSASWKARRRELAAASEFLQGAVALGEPIALHAAANETDEDVAVTLYIAAADAGFAGSAWNLYVHFHDLDEATSAELWLDRAAKLGDKDAIRTLRAQAR